MRINEFILRFKSDSQITDKQLRRIQKYDRVNIRDFVSFIVSNVLSGQDATCACHPPEVLTQKICGFFQQLTDDQFENLKSNLFLRCNDLTLSSKDLESISDKYDQIQSAKISENTSLTVEEYCKNLNCEGACGLKHTADWIKQRTKQISTPISSTHECNDPGCSIDHSSQSPNSQRVPSSNQSISNQTHSVSNENFHPFKGKGLNVTLGLAFTGLVGAMAYFILSGKKKNEQSEVNVSNVIQLSLPPNSVKASSSESHSLPLNTTAGSLQALPGGLTANLQAALKVA